MKKRLQRLIKSSW